MAISDYDLGELVSQTNMSEVWSAIETRNGRRVALKRRPGGVRAEKRFMREIESQRAAAGPHTMPILDWDDSFDWYAMPWADRSLADSNVPDVLLVPAVVEAIAVSLKPLHDTGQVHRDLKPENILWLEDDCPGRWVVADFGIVRNSPGETTSTLTVAGAPLGSIGWMAPEQHGAAHDSTPSTDVYAAGAIISWLLTGRRPTPTRVEPPAHSSGLRHVVWKATRERQADRYTTVEELRVAVAAASAPRTVSLADIIASRDYSAVVAFAMSHSSAYELLVEELPHLSRQDVRNWYSRDPDGVVTTTLSVLDALIEDGVSDLPYPVVDRFLSWTLHVVESDLPHDIDRAEKVAGGLFRAIAVIHQFAPAKDVLDWLDRQSIENQRVMEAALQMAEAWDFFAAQASGRFLTSRTTPLVRRLSGGKSS